MGDKILIKIEEKITEKTKAILGVHLYGQPFEFGKVKEIADKYQLYVVEDCAQSMEHYMTGKWLERLVTWDVLVFIRGKICMPLEKAEA